ncbi:MAG: squalene cyclase [Devosia sp.]|nr:squalene cyclase [Devosia sp.]
MRRRETIVRWLLAGDPAIRWQALRDLTDAPADAIAVERARVATEGWGAGLLAAQQPNGQWGEGEDPGWMIAIRTLTLLKDMGPDPAAAPVRRAIERVKPLRFVWHDNRLFFSGETEACLNGRILGLGAYFGEPNEGLLARLLGEQLADGGWNCDAPPSTVSSFHSTICVLEGLLACDEATGPASEIAAARARAENYLLERRLLRGRRSGKIIDRRFTRFGFHPNWEYDVLRGLDYFRSAGARPDARMGEAIGIVRERAHQNGLWPLNRLGPGAIGFVTESETGRASRWNTLRALRVLDWFEAAAGADDSAPLSRARA